MNQSTQPVINQGPTQPQVNPTEPNPPENQTQERLLAMLLQQMQGQNNVQTQGTKNHIKACPVLC